MQPQNESRLFQRCIKTEASHFVITYNSVCLDLFTITTTYLSSSLWVQTGTLAHPAFFKMGTVVKKRPGRDADHQLPSSAEVKNDRSYPSVPQASFLVCSGSTLLHSYTTQSIHFWTGIFLKQVELYWSNDIYNFSYHTYLAYSYLISRKYVFECVALLFHNRLQ
jgi:hypothetical protein